MLCSALLLSVFEKKWGKNRKIGNKKIIYVYGGI